MKNNNFTATLLYVFQMSRPFWYDIRVCKTLSAGQYFTRLTASFDLLSDI